MGFAFPNSRPGIGVPITVIPPLGEEPQVSPLGEDDLSLEHRNTDAPLPDEVAHEWTREVDALVALPLQATFADDIISPCSAAESLPSLDFPPLRLVSLSIIFWR